MIKEQSPLAGKTLKVIDGQFKGQDFTVEDYACNVWDTIDWDLKWNNPAVLEYLATRQGSYLPNDTQTALYGKIGLFGHVLQRRELEDGMAPNKNCPWCGHTPELLDARDLMDCKEDSIDYDIKYPYFVRCINAMCNVQPITRGAETAERALEQWNTMQSAVVIGL